MLQIFDFEQGTPEWHQARCGVPTASEFDAVLTKRYSLNEQVEKLVSKVFPKRGAKAKKQGMLDSVNEFLQQRGCQSLSLKDVESAHAFAKLIGSIYQDKKASDRLERFLEDIQRTMGDRNPLKDYKNQTWEPSKVRAKYIRRLAAQRITDNISGGFNNIHMDRGTEFEEEAREAYKARTGNNIKRCGFMKDRFGYSPDGLIGEEGLIEIKTRLDDLQIELLLDGRVPSEHIAQIQGGLMISGRQWCDFVAYSPGLPIFISRVERDEEYIENLRAELEIFEQEIQDVMEKIMSMY